MLNLAIAGDAPVVRRSAGLFLLLLAALAVVWFAPAMPYWKQDSAWPAALNAATADRLAFGRDVLFTFGPWSAVYTGVYDPATDRMMLAGGMIIAVAIAAGLHATARGGRLWATFLVPLLIATVALHDPVFLILPMLLIVLAVGLAQPASRPARIECTASSVSALLLLISGDALLTFIKLTSGTEALAMAGLALLALAAGRRFGLALLALAVFCASLIGYWLAAGQTLDNLIRYFASAPLVIAGYAEGQALDGAWTDIAAYLVGVALLLWLVWRDRAACRLDGTLLIVGALMLLLFLAFKAGFVRHDEHALIALGTLAMCPVVLANVLRVRSLLSTLAVTGLALAFVSHHCPGDEWPSEARGRDHLFSSAAGAWERVIEPASLPKQYAADLADVRARMPLPRASGPADFYSSGQVILLANRLDWSPRPALQSVTAFNRVIAAADLHHLEGVGRSAAVQNVFFQVENDDDRLPTLEDGLSWPALLGEFRVASYDSMLETAFFRRQAGAHASSPGADVLRTSGRMGQTLPLPASPSGLSWATIVIRPTVAGRLADILFRPPILWVQIRYANGVVSRYRLLSDLAAAGFMLTPPISTTQDMLLLLLPERRSPSYRPVSLTITGETGARWAWRSRYDLRLQSIDVPPQPGVRDLVEADPQPVEMNGGEHVQPAADICRFDLIGDQSPSMNVIKVSGETRVEGWAVVDRAIRASPDRILLRLTDPTGHVWKAAAQRRLRPDVAGYFVNPALRASGFDTILDLSRLSGDFDLSIELEQSGKRWACPTNQKLRVGPLSGG